MTHTIIYKVRDVAAYVNWLYFFHAWHFPSSYAAISRVHGCVACRTNWQQRFPDEERPRVDEAMKLYDEAQRLLAEWDAAGIEVRFRVCLEAANSEGDDILLLESGLRLPMLRQQVAHDGVCLCLADFVRPKSKGGTEDRVGVFASTVESRAERWDEDDEFRRMLSQTLADRLAEAAAEAGHQQVRRRLWGYAPDENLQPDELFRELFVGRRPAVGYPSLPDQSLNFLLERVLDFASLGISLTETGAMRPHASTSGLMLAHPACRHFAVGHIGEDQLRDYAQRRGESVERLRPFLAGLL